MEALAAIRAAECWDWPIPPPVNRPRPKLLYSYSHTEKPRIDSIDFATPFDSLAWTWGDSRRCSSLSDDVPRRTNSSALSSELGPLTPDEVPSDPFDRLAASITTKPPPRPPLTRASRSATNLPPARFGVPF